MYQFIYTANARQDLKNLDFQVARRIIKKIDFWSLQKDPLKFAKRLNNSPLGTYRFRVGDYRILFDINRKGEISLVMILNIKHRKDAYDL